MKLNRIAKKTTRGERDRKEKKEKQQTHTYIYN